MKGNTYEGMLCGMAIVEGQKIKLRWNNANRKHYESLNYEFTKNGDDLVVDIKHLSKGSKSIVNAKCDWCGIIFERTMHQLNRKNQSHHFCNNKCQHDFRSDEAYKNKPVKNCEQCEKEYKVDKYYLESSRFCSAKCLAEWQSIAFKGEGSSVYVERVEVKCEWCNKSIYRTPNRVSKLKYNFCDTECKNTWHSEVYVKTEEFRELMSNVALNNLAQGKYKFTDTQPHRAIKELLDDLRINYKCEYVIGKFSFDLYLTNYNLLIEVNGGYWHCDPRLYKEVNYIQQLNRIIQDKKKRTFVRNSYKSKILYLWELDINTDIDVCKELIMRFIEGKGKLKDYNSFNYFLDENDSLRLEKSIIKSYMDISNDELMKITDLTVRKERTGYDPLKNIVFNCDNCGKEKLQNLKYYLKSENHFCSTLCKNLFQQIGNDTNNLRHEYPCDNCGVKLNVKNYIYQEFLQGERKCITCSRKCQGEWVGRNKVKNLICVNCLQCGKDDLIPHHRLTSYKYCSKECQIDSTRKKIKFNCELCGRESTKTPSQFKKTKNHFCSRNCANTFRSKKTTVV